MLLTLNAISFGQEIDIPNKILSYIMHWEWYVHVCVTQKGKKRPEMQKVDNGAKRKTLENESMD